MKVNTIQYMATDFAAEFTDSLRLYIQLMKKDESVWTGFFEGNSNSLSGSTLKVPDVEADTILFSATDLEYDKQFLVVNGVAFQLPTAGNNVTKEYSYPLPETRSPLLIIVGIATLIGIVVYAVLKK